MRRLAVIAISVLVMSAGQVCAQTTERSAPATDLFGPDVITPNDAAPARRKSDPKPKNEPMDQPRTRAMSQPDALFPPVRVGRAGTVHERIENALNREASFDYLDQPLKDVVEDISFHNDIPIIIDTVALEDYGIDTGTPITRSLKGLRLRSVLRLILRDLALTFVIRDEVLRITTTDAAASLPSTRFYHVAELLPPNGDGKVLVELIKSLVAPNTWCGADSVGAIIYVEHLESLAIRQTDDVFYEIEELLETTKKLAELQPARNPILDATVGGVIAE